MHVRRLALVAILALAAAPALWAAGPAPVPTAAQAPAPAVDGPATQAPGQALVTPDPQARGQVQGQALTLPVTAGIPGIRPERQIGCFYCFDECPRGGHITGAGCACC